MFSLITSLTLPLWYVVPLFFILGAVIGSFVEVFVYRYNTNVSINKPSHCLSCGKRLRWYELIPVLSYVVQRGRCTKCTARIPRQDFAVETMFGVLTLSLLWVADSWIQFGFMVVTLGVLLAIALYDSMHFIIPDALLVVLAGVFVVESIFLGTFSLEKIIWHIVAIAGSFLFFYSLWFLSEGRWVGFGDAKLAAVLSIPMTPFFAVSMITFSFWIGSVIMLLLIGVSYLRFVYTTKHVEKSRKSFTIQHKVPFAPFLVISYVVVQVFQYNLADFFVYYAL